MFNNNNVNKSNKLINEKKCIKIYTAIDKINDSLCVKILNE